MVNISITNMEFEELILMLEGHESNWELYEQDTECPERMSPRISIMIERLRAHYIVSLVKEESDKPQ